MAVLGKYPLGSGEVEERKSIEHQWAAAKKAESANKKTKGAPQSPDLPALTTMENIDGTVYVQGNQTLEVINLGYNSMGDDSVKAFCSKMTAQKDTLSPKLTCIALQKNHLSDTAKEALQV